MPKRHFRGNNKKDDKRKRAENHSNWKNKKTRTDDAKGSSNYDSYFTTPQNPRFEAFYKTQLFDNNESDYQSFLSSLRDSLPACFRINSNIDEYTSNELKSELMEFVGKSQVIDGREV